MTASVPTDRTARALRVSAWATFGFALLQAWFLPMPLHRGSGSGWVFEFATVLRIATSVVAAVFLWRRSRIAGALAGLYGAWYVALLGLAVVWILDGTAGGMENGPAWILHKAVLFPFAVLWLRGGLAVLREWRMHTRGMPGTREIPS